ncbi:hypothetical protein AMET1_1213 [Methanonatronarchaeum thermophilum]|uniref:Uncharacterized protein n=1 Tax=Methanonatronarchaeum thermophilum TaxID=1927129 RepID=A0A1Y3GA31_9EURY|nr:hypothetical protein [Methanonatronarchaeum thermophilum]OUJ18302.1 hypothetical protein AMET1_1213 [Methanonatronarchaeum thermophilum]
METGISIILGLTIFLISETLYRICSEYEYYLEPYGSIESKDDDERENYLEYGYCVEPYGSIESKDDDELKNIKAESKEYASRALILSVIVFAAIPFWYQTIGIDRGESIIIISVFSLLLFLTSYKLYEFIGNRRIYWFLQDRTLDFGILAIMIAIVFFVFMDLNIVTKIFSSIFLVFYIILQLKEIIDDCRAIPKK